MLVLEASFCRFDRGFGSTVKTCFCNLLDKNWRFTPCDLQQAVDVQQPLRDVEFRTVPGAHAE